MIVYVRAYIFSKIAYMANGLISVGTLRLENKNKISK